MPRVRRFSDSLPMLLLRARETTLARFRPILHEHGITEQQWRALRALDDIGELSAAALSHECSILAPSMTRILRKLGRDGLVVANRSKDDQRALQVRISARGKKLVDTVGPRIEREYERLRQQLEPSHLDALHRELRVLIDLGDAAD